MLKPSDNYAIEEAHDLAKAQLFHKPSCWYSKPFMTNMNAFVRHENNLLLVINTTHHLFPELGKGVYVFVSEHAHISKIRL